MNSIQDLITEILTNGKGEPRNRFALLWLWVRTRDSRALWAFWNYRKFGFTTLTYRGIPIVKD